MPMRVQGGLFNIYISHSLADDYIIPIVFSLQIWIFHSISRAVHDFSTFHIPHSHVCGTRTPDTILAIQKDNGLLIPGFMVVTCYFPFIASQRTYTHTHVWVSILHAYFPFHCNSACTICFQHNPYLMSIVQLPIRFENVSESHGYPSFLFRFFSFQIRILDFGKTHAQMYVMLRIVSIRFDILRFHTNSVKIITSELHAIRMNPIGLMSDCRFSNEAFLYKCGLASLNYIKFLIFLLCTTIMIYIVISF